MIRFGRWSGRGLNWWSKIPRGSPTISKIKVNFHQDFMASTHSDFFYAQMDGGIVYWPSLSGETQLSSDEEEEEEEEYMPSVS
jgi:hypothetical protein